MIAPELAAVLKSATGGADLIATPGGRPGKWVIGFTSFKTEQRIRADLERAGLRLLKLEAVGVGDYVAVIERG